VCQRFFILTKICFHPSFCVVYAAEKTEFNHVMVLSRLVCLISWVQNRVKNYVFVLWYICGSSLHTCRLFFQKGNDISIWFYFSSIPFLLLLKVCIKNWKQKKPKVLGWCNISKIYTYVKLNTLFFVFKQTTLL
jgi:hypothetical protein